MTPFASNTRKYLLSTFWNHRSFISTCRSTNYQQAIDFTDHRPLTDLPFPHLVRASFILRLCSSNWIVSHSLEAMQLLTRLTGTRFTSSLLKPTFYRQFIGGETQEEILQSAESLTKHNIKPLLMLSLEHTGENNLTKAELQNIFECNCQKIITGIDTTSKFGINKILMQIKLSSVLTNSVLEMLSDLWHDEVDSNGEVAVHLVKMLTKCFQDGSQLPVELKELILAKTKKTISLDLMEFGLKAIAKICDHAQKKQIKLLVDAEYTTINEGLSALTLALSCVYNNSECIIWNTYQCYLKHTYNSFEHHVAFLHSNGISFGAKIVRGAYMNWENQRAKCLRIDSPVHDCYENTNTSYNDTVKLFLEKVAENPNNTEGIIATHNTNSILVALTEMDRLGIAADSMVMFGQIYGMADNVSYALAKYRASHQNDSHYQVYKSMAVGTLTETLPYLSRRALENQGVFKGLRLERTILRNAMIDKLIKGLIK